MAEIKVLSSTAMKPTLDAVSAEFERASGQTVTFDFAPSVQIARRVAAGEASDVIIATSQGIDDLMALQKVIAGTRADIASSVIGLAVRKGAPKPDISTLEGFRRAMLATKSIAMSHPINGGPSGAHLAGVFERLGIAEALKPKLTFGPGGPAGLIGNFVRTGQVETGLQQIPELMAVSNIDVVGPLPEEIQLVTVFSVGLSAAAERVDAGKALIAFLKTPAVAAVIQGKGMSLPARR